METRIQYRGGTGFTAETRGHRVECDQPVSHGGADTGMTPPEFLLVSLGTCAGYYAAEYLRIHALPSQGLEIRVAAEKALRPARLAGFRIEVIVPGLDAAHEAGILRAVNACLVKNTLAAPPAVETVVLAAEPAPA